MLRKITQQFSINSNREPTYSATRLDLHLHCDGLHRVSRQSSAQ